MPDGVLPYSAYPFMLHKEFVLPWNIHVVNHLLSIQLIHCTGVWQTLSDSCEACSQLLTHQIVEGILYQLKNGIHTNTNFVYQPIAGLIEILQKKCAMLDGLHFKQLLTLQTLVTWAWTLGQYEQFVMAMSEGNVNHLDTLLWVGLNCRLGLRGMMELLDRVRKGLYKPRNFTEEEMSCGLLFLQLGGACVASLVQQTLSAPMLSTLHYVSAAKSIITHFCPLQAFPPSSKYRAISEQLSRTHVGILDAGTSLWLMKSK